MHWRESANKAQHWEAFRRLPAFVTAHLILGQHLLPREEAGDAKGCSVWCGSTPLPASYSLAILASRKLKDCEPGWPGNQVSCGHSRKSPRHIFSSCTVFIQAIQFSHSWCPFERTIGFLGPRCARNAKSICSGCLCHTVQYLNLQGLGCWCRVRNQSISGMRWALEALLQERCWIQINELNLLTESMIK